jgi:hypothetical protein
MELKKQTPESAAVYVAWKDTDTLEDLEINYMIIFKVF